MKNCVFAGSFDPITIGHESIIEKCLNAYDKVLVVVGDNGNKKSVFTFAERVEIISFVYRDQPKVKVIDYSKVKQDYVSLLKREGVTEYVRGIRNQIDEDYENAQIQQNKEIYPFIKTVFISADNEYKDVSSTLVRNKLANKEDLTGVVSQRAKEKIKQILSKNN